MVRMGGDCGWFLMDIVIYRITMEKKAKMFTKFEDYIAKSIENQHNNAIYESLYSQNEIEEIVKNYVLVDHNLIVKDENVTIELLESPSKEAHFDEKMWGQKLFLVKNNEEGSVANYTVKKVDEGEKRRFEEDLIIKWLTTIEDNHEDWTWDGNKLLLLDESLETVASYTRDELKKQIKEFPYI